MYKILSAIICLVFTLSSSAETVYKTTNPDGSVTFTDRESVDSEKVKVKKAQTYKAPRSPSLPLATKKLSPSVSYTLSIVQPGVDTNIINTDTVSVSVALLPALKTAYGHKIRYQLAEQTVLTQSTSHTFNNVYRGTHELKVAVVDKQGDPISPVAITRFHVKRFFKKQK